MASAGFLWPASLKSLLGASLVAQGLRRCTPKARGQVQPLVRCMTQPLEEATQNCAGGSLPSQHLGAAASAAPQRAPSLSAAFSLCVSHCRS